MGPRLKLVARAAALAGCLSGCTQTRAIVPPTEYGINLSGIHYYYPRAFANLLIGHEWRSSVPGQEKVTEPFVDADGNLKALPQGQTVARMLAQPNGPEGSYTIRCTFQGKGTLNPPSQAHGNVRVGPGFITFQWTKVDVLRHEGMGPLKVTALDAKDPIRNLDCREDTMARDLRFDPQFVRSLKGFKVLRFMDWQNTNAAGPVRWESRNRPLSIDVLKPDGVSIEDMIALSRAVGADPWFSMPWNADDEYVRNFARLVHDSLPADRKVYVEEGNEIWNLAFKAAKQSIEEAKTENLSSNLAEAGLRRYAEKTAHVMDIWAKVFADHPGRLVRVASCQNASLSCAKTVMSFRDTPKHIDALASAPYFGYDVSLQPSADLNTIFGQVDQSADRAINNALAIKQLAATYHKRYIAYEAGQHILTRDLVLAQRLQRSPRMYDSYRRYLKEWHDRIGDLITLYYSAGPINSSGSWGLAEFIGQSPADAPKLRAVNEALEHGAK